MLKHCRTRLESASRSVRGQEDTKAFYSWFSGQAYRQDRAAPGGYPAIRIFPVYGKRAITMRTILAFIAGSTIWGCWHRPEKERFQMEMVMETQERAMIQVPYNKAECNLRMLISAYKRHRYEQECLLDKGYVGLTSEFRKFYYHDDCWRPPFVDVLAHPYMKTGGLTTSYNWTMGGW